MPIKGFEHICLQNFTRNSQKLEATQTSIIRLMNKQIVVYSHNRILLSNKLLICVTRMNLKVRQKKKEHIL